MFLRLLCLALIIAGSAQARPIEGIAAIVNDEVISLYDVDQRVTLTLASSGIQETPEVTERIRAQVLRSLVDEKLQLQEANRVEIQINDEEIEQSFDRLAADNNMSREGIQEFLTENSIGENVLRQQIHAELAWNQFIRRSFGGRVTIGETEIDEQFERTMRAIDQPRYNLSEILLPYDNFTDEDRVRKLSLDIINQLREGIDFSAVARQFSISPSAASGGQLGWVSADQLDPALARALTQMQPSQISPPIVTSAGIYIVVMQDRRIGTARDVMQDRFDLLNIRYPTDAMAQLITFRENFTTCTAATEQLESEEGVQFNRTGFISLAQVPPQLRDTLSALEAGAISQPQEDENGINMLIVCNRRNDQGINVSRKDIADNIYSQRVSMMARRHLRDLRRDAVVEYR